MKSIAPFTPAIPENEQNFDESLRPIPPYTNRGGMETTPHNTLSPDYQSLTPPTQTISCIIDYLSFTFSLDRLVMDRKIQRVRKMPVTETGQLTAPEYIECEWDYIGDDAVVVTDQTAPDIEVLRLVASLSKMVSSLDYIKNDKGIFGYKQSLSLYRDGQHCGKVAWNGNGGTCLVSFSGYGTSGVNMRQMQLYMMRLPAVNITRVDLAHDDMEGKITIDDWLNHYDDGKFHIRGKMPNRRMIDDFDSGEGKTLYIGRLTNGKECCIYQKGKQLGDKESPWIRVEGRLSSVDRQVPLDVLVSPEMYMAALYPAFSYLCAFHERIDVIKKHTQIAYGEALKHASLQVGKLLNVMQELGKTSDEIIAALVRPGVPKRLQIPLIA